MLEARDVQNQERRYHRDISVPVNKPIIITFLAMEKVILLCICKTPWAGKGSDAVENFFSAD